MGTITAIVIDSNSYRLFVVGSTGPRLGRPDDAVDLMSRAWEQKADVVVVPVERFVPEFFVLRSLLAGEFTQKFVNYGVRLAILGDISAKTGERTALADFVRECNRGTSILFVPDVDTLLAKLSKL